jgi:hypothetical protein
VIVSPDLVKLIRHSHKTTHREPLTRTCRYRINHDYAVQHSIREPHEIRIFVTAIIEEPLEAIHDETKLAAEGFTSLEQFRDYWRDRYKLPASQPVDWDQPVRVIHFIPARDRVIYRKEPIRLIGLKAGYTSDPKRALVREPEALDPATIKDLPASVEAQQRWIRDRTYTEAVEHDGGLTERLDRALIEARRNRIDTTSIEWLLNRKVTELERRNQRAA